MKKVIMSFLLLIAFQGVLWAETITIVADKRFPYNGEPGSSEPGFIIEIAIEVFMEKGHTVIYKKMDWDEAVKDTREGKYTAIVGAAKGDAPDFIFPKLAQAVTNAYMFVKKGDTWRYIGLDSIKEKKIAIITGHAYDEDFDKFISTSKASVKNSSLTESVELLLGSKVTALIEDSYVLSAFSMKHFIEGSMESAGQVGVPEAVYIAFSPVDPKSEGYAEIIDNGMKRLRSSGQFKKILCKYGLKDWAK